MKIEVEKGMSIWNTCDKAKAIALDALDEVTFDFNGIELTVRPGSWPDDIAEIYNLKSTIRRMQAETELSRP